MEVFQSQFIKTDVTALKLLDEHILAGIGNFLFVFDKKGVVLGKIQVFEGELIHGIEIDDDSNTCLCFGGCHIHTFKYESWKFTTRKKGQIHSWILAGRWLKNDRIAMVVMSNELLLYDASNLKMLYKLLCKEKCILYSAFIAYDKSQDEVVVLSGTVFGQVLIWKDDSRVSAKLQGHNGVIFSVHYNEDSGYICSSSDDRSSILWRTKNKSIFKELEQTNPDITLFHKFYGHRSRIFKCLVLDTMLLTAGEDAHVNVWSFQGELLNKISGHGPIWALDSKDASIVCGGGACGILLSSVTCESTCRRLSVPENARPKRLVLMVNNDVVVMSEKGVLYRYVYQTETWAEIGRHVELKSYNLLQVSKCRRLVSLSGYKGEIYIYRQQEDGAIRLAASTQTGNRIHSFHWLTCGTWLICEAEGAISLYCMKKDEIFHVTDFRLPQSKHFSTAACQAENGRYIIGDNKGDIHLYELKSSTPVWSCKRVHNYLGVTRVYNVDNQIVSLGRQGTVSTVSLKEQKVVARDKVPFAWLAELIGDLVVAFSGDSLVLWHYPSRRTLFQHVCGGGHRSWDLFQDVFAYVKESRINLVQFDEKQITSSHTTPDFHVDTINSVRIVAPFLISGSEDTHLRVSRMERDHLTPVRDFKTHLSSIRSICVHEIDEKSRLVFSGGGRGQIIVWKLDCESSELNLEYSLYEKSQESEIRVMDLETSTSNGTLYLFAALSDGKINMFKVTTEQSRYKIELSKTLSYKIKCVCKIRSIENWHVLISSSTDGNVQFWDPKDERPLENSKIHQSAIVTLHFHVINDDLGVLLTGGDDASVVLSLYDRNFVLLDRFKDVSSHCAQVTGIWANSTHFLTTGVDQKLLLYRWSVDCLRLSCRLCARYDAAIADIQGMQCFMDGQFLRVLLYGKGVECVKILENIRS